MIVLAGLVQLPLLARGVRRADAAYLVWLGLVAWLLVPR